MKKNILLTTILIALTFTANTFAAEWASRYHGLSATYNGKTWKVIQTIDKKKDTILALHDKKDGSSIFIRMEYLEGVEGYPDAAIAESLADSLHKSDSMLQKIKPQNINISGKHFYAADYLFKNKIYGKQRVRHAFHKSKNYLLIMLFAWPADLPMTKNKPFPAKHLEFINGLKL